MNYCVFVDDAVKPTVVHRDVNSRNILVKADLSLCLCDFGFAMKIASSGLTPQTNDDHSSLADVSCLSLSLSLPLSLSFWPDGIRGA